jgi:hypothetical protein
MFLYSGANIAGCVLAMGGLGLFFSGIVHAYWWAIVAGLYGAGALGWPKSDLAQTAERTELTAGALSEQVRKLVDSVSKGLPNDALIELRNIEATLTELLPRMKEMQDRGVIGGKESFTVLETVRRYLPDTLGAYLRLPKFYAEMQPLAQGQTAAQILTGQLKLLNGSLQEIARNAFTGDAQKLMTNGQFLQDKFSRVTAFQP